MPCVGVYLLKLKNLGCQILGPSFDQVLQEMASAKSLESRRMALPTITAFRKLYCSSFPNTSSRRSRGILLAMALSNANAPPVKSLSPSRVIRITIVLKKPSSCIRHGQTVLKPNLALVVETSLRKIESAGRTMLTSACDTITEMICT